jgi:hypothetical protein
LFGRFFQHIRTAWDAVNGQVPDIHFYVDCGERYPSGFGRIGKIKIHPSLLPWIDMGLKQVASRFGGCRKITEPDYHPTDSLYSELAAVRFTKEDFDKTRAYIGDERKYISQALRKLKQRQLNFLMSKIQQLEVRCAEAKAHDRIDLEEQLISCKGTYQRLIVELEARPDELAE